MKKLLLAVVALSAAIIPALASAQSPDQDAQRTVEDYVVEREIMFRGADGDFHPGEPVTRLEFTLAVVDNFYGEINAEGCFDDIASSLPADFTLLFSDVERESWYAKRLCIAMRSGLITGDRDGSFRPFDAITVSEASKIMARAYGLLYPPKNIPTRQWYEGPMEALNMHDALPVNAKHDDRLRRIDMAVMYYQLQDVERFPESRIIGIAPIRTASKPVEQTCIVAGEIAGMSVQCAKLEAGVSVTIGTFSTIQPSSQATQRPMKMSHRLLRRQVLQSRDARAGVRYTAP